MKSGGGVPHVYPSDIDNFLIPLPPLPVQEEIVRILDTFTELEAELEAEQEARKKQYEYYRNKLLTPVEIHGKWYLNDKEVEWKKLGEVGTLIRGNGLQKKDFVEKGVGCIHYGQIYTYYGTFADKTISFVSPEMAKKLKKVGKGDLIIACTSENIEDVCKTVAWIGENDIVIGGHSTIFKHKQNGKYLSYYFQTKHFYNQKVKYAKGTKVIELSTSDLSKILIPILPISEQERIVAILDKFDALVNDLTAGLPAEIAARRKQYEYYRNRLLTFPAKKISDVAINENQS
jgi:type I restriction enzyme S subunit